MAVELTITRTSPNHVIVTGERELGGPPYYTTLNVTDIPADNLAGHVAYHAQASLGITGTKVTVVDDGKTERVVSFKVPGG